MDQETIVPGGTLTLTALASDEVGVSSLEVTIDGAPAQLDENGQLDFSSSSPGVHTVVVTAVDASGNVSTKTLLVGVQDAGDTTPPVVAISTPAKDAEATYLQAIVGTASDPNLMGYTLEQRRIGESSWTQVAQGYQSVQDGALGTLDATLLRDGYYELRLTAHDVNGQSSQVAIPVRVEGQAKVGVVQLSFVDMAVPMAGIPITVVRSYDSRDKNKQDFGYGWRLDVKQGSLQHNRAPGSEWFVTYPDTPYGFNFPCTITLEHEQHLTEVRLSEREWTSCSSCCAACLTRTTAWSGVRCSCSTPAATPIHAWRPPRTRSASASVSSSVACWPAWGCCPSATPACAASSVRSSACKPVARWPRSHSWRATTTSHTSSASSRASPAPRRAGSQAAPTRPCSDRPPRDNVGFVQSPARARAHVGSGGYETNMTTPDIFSNVHKGIRRALFSTCGTLGRARDGEPSLQAAREQLRDTLHFIDHHGDNEDALLLPLLQQHAPAVHARMRAAHADIHVALASLRSQLDGAPAAALYHASCRLTALYLEHLHEEEVELEPQIRAALSVQALLELGKQAVARTAPADQRAMLGWMLPALPRADAEGFLGELPPALAAELRPVCA